MRVYNPQPRGVIAAVAVCALLIAGCGSDEGTVEGPDPPNPVAGPDTTAPAAISNLAARSPTARSVALVFKAPGDDGYSGRAAAYDVRYATSPITPISWDAAEQMDGEPQPLPGGQLETFRVLGLNSVTTYYFAVTTADDSGNVAPMSNVVSATTLQETAPPSPVSDLSALAVSETAVQLTWTATGDDALWGTATSYDIRYSTSPIVEGNWASATPVATTPAPLPSGSEQVFVAEGIDANKNLFFAMKVADEVPNTSGVSNTTPSMGYTTHLWIRPKTDLVYGETVTIYYRTSPAERTDLGVHRSLIESCSSAEIFLRSGTFAPGVYETTYDFFDPGTGAYLPEGIYKVAVCWGQEIVASVNVQLCDPENEESPCWEGNASSVNDQLND